MGAYYTNNPNLWWNVRTEKGGPGFLVGRRRLVAGGSPAQPALPTTGALTHSTGESSGLWMVCLLVVAAVMLCWLVGRRFLRSRPKPRFIEPDLEAGLPRK